MKERQIAIVIFADEGADLGPVLDELAKKLKSGASGGTGGDEKVAYQFLIR